MWPNWTLMRRDPNLVNTFRVLWGLSLLALVLPGPEARPAAVWTLLLATLWGARTGAWVHEDREAGLVARAQVLTAGSTGSRTRRLLAGFGGALVGGLAMGLPHALLGGLVLLPPASDVAVLTFPLAGLAALAGYGLGTGLHPALGDGTTAAVATIAPGAAAAYWLWRPSVVLGVPPSMLAFSVVPPRGVDPWAWGFALPLASVLVPLLAGSVAAVGSPRARALGVDPRWSLLLAPLVVVGLAAGSPGPAPGPASDDATARAGVAVLLPDRPDEVTAGLDAAEATGTPPNPTRFEPAEVPIRGERDVVVYVAPVPDPAPSTLRWRGGEAALDDRLGIWTFEGTQPHGRTHEAGLWTATATIHRSPEYHDRTLAPRDLESPAGYAVHVDASLPFHPAWAVAAGLPGLAAAAPATRWWGVPDA